MSDKSYFTRAWNEVKRKPLFYGGFTACTGIAAYGFYGLRHRDRRLSLYLINLRLAAQGSFAAILTAGVTYMMFQRYVMKNEDFELVDKKVK